MAVSIPTTLIREIQSRLRAGAGVPSYDPADPALRRLPAAEEAISGLDTSGPPRPHCISFNTTVGYRRLLQSLGLDGSEVVLTNTKSKDSIKDQGMEGDLALSDYLNIELRCHFEGVENQGSNSNNERPQSAYALNLSGIDLDNYFSDAKKETASDVHIGANEMSFSEKEADLENVDLFENLRSFEKSVYPVETKQSEFVDSFAAWDVEFPSASAHVSAADPSSRDFFQEYFPQKFTGPTAGEQLSIESGSNLEGNTSEVSKSSSQLHYASDAWPLDDLWHSTGSVAASNAAEQFRSSDILDEGDLKPPMAQDPAQDDLWPTSSSSISDPAKLQTNDDPYDDWQDFTGSRNAADSSSSQWPQAGSEVTFSKEDKSGVSLVSTTDKLEDMDFGSFFQSDVIPGLGKFGEDSSQLSAIQSQALVSGRTNGWEETKMVASSPMVPPGDTKAIVEALLSQMPDLSFMLEDGLSIPGKPRPSDPAP
ncbi:unnamed protein product [Spirodela intermedia]|uniref:Uncharacterized protein n=2 Tax=Spirodela intermedia TaxID=51605 RepID=A0A7I8KN24_SPIIN|nr:unnamed protein product [Spirodela intermedia]CAA6662299.1 unnamed protein product [Spirodela intermedia]CAA7398696.1 unnamed protein product [Spirodela intermedia]